MNYSILNGLNQNKEQCLYCDNEAYVELTIRLKAVEKNHICESRFCSIRNPILESNVRLCSICLNEKIPHDFTHFGTIKTL